MDGGLFVKKVPALRTLVAGAPLAEIDPRIPPAPEDLVIVKNYPSCFFGTSLASTLAGLGVDTVILTGCSTSGCVRAAAIDARFGGDFARDFRPAFERLLRFQDDGIIGAREQRQREREGDDDEDHGMRRDLRAPTPPLRADHRSTLSRARRGACGQLRRASGRRA